MDGDTYMLVQDRNGDPKKIATRPTKDDPSVLMHIGTAEGQVYDPDGYAIMPITSTRAKFVDGFNGAAINTTERWTLLRDTGITKAVSGGSLTLGMGTANGSEFLMYGKAGLGIPANLLAILQLSQRIAGNEIRIGYVEVDVDTGVPVPHATLPNFFRNYCCVMFNGTVATTCTLESMSTDAPSAVTVSMTSQQTTASVAEYSMELRPEDVIATSQAVNALSARIGTGGRVSSQVPAPDKLYAPFVWVRNVSAPASNTNLILQRILSMDIQELQAEIGGGRGNIAAAQSIPVNITGAVTTSTSATIANASMTAGTNGNLYHSLLSAATTNATSVKATAGRIYGGIILNTGATISWLKFYAKATAPVVGTDTPIFRIPLLPNIPVNIAALFDQYGLYIATGVAYAITKNYADADTTAVGAGEVSVGLLYA